MKTNEILSEIRKGNLVFNLKVVSPKGYDKNVEEISIATTLYYKKHVSKQEGDEVVTIYGKEFNISEFSRIINQYKGSEIHARIGNKSIVIEWDEIEEERDAITTLEELRDYINSNADWDIHVNTIIEQNGWVDETGEDYGICHDGEQRLMFHESDGDLEAYIQSL